MFVCLSSFPTGLWAQRSLLPFMGWGWGRRRCGGRCGRGRLEGTAPVYAWDDHGNHETVLSKTHLVTIRLPTKTEMPFKKTIRQQSDCNLMDHQTIKEKVRLPLWLIDGRASAKILTMHCRRPFLLLSQQISHLDGLLQTNSFWKVGVFESTENHDQGSRPWELNPALPNAKREC